jgi:hypothetical protein
VKINILKSFLLLATFALFVCCSKEEPSPNTNLTPNPDVNLGSFVGNLQVANDPQTSLGYVYNTKVEVIATGNNTTIKVTGDEGFDREYTGTITSSSSSSKFIEIKRQTKPVDKIAGTNMLINGNEVTITINLASDNIVVKPNPTATNTVNISGKIQLIGTNLLRE